MGLLRIIFALAVVLIHVSPMSSENIRLGYLAVYSFFIVSGFYMSLVLNEKYIGVNKSFSLFITNRFLRIYPLYLVVLVLTVVVSIIFIELRIPNPISAYLLLQTNPVNQYFDIVRNITLLFGPEWYSSPKILPGYLLLPQAWSLQLELIFYLTAPFLFRKKVYWLILLMGGGLAFDYLFVYPYQLFYGQPLVYKFFESYVYFLLGGLSYKTYSVLKKWRIKRSILGFVFIVFVSFVVIYNFFHLDLLRFIVHSHTDWIYYILLVLVIPFIFMLTKKEKLDSQLGDLSYPIYISHILVILVSKVFFTSANGTLYQIAIIILSILLSIVLVYIIDKPIDTWRQSRLQKSGSSPYG